MKLTVTALLLLTAAICFAGEPKPIANGSTLFVDTNNGFDLFILAAFQAKGVPMKLVSTREEADYVLDSSLFHDKGFAASGSTAGTYRISEAAFKLTSKSGQLIWAYAATKGMFSKGGGKQSVAESCAKHLKALCGKPPKH